MKRKNNLICYCHGYTETEIIEDYLTHNGHSTILVQITEAKKKGTCQCDIKHPEKQ